MTKIPEEAQAPDALDALALQLVSLQHQLNALGGMVQASLLSVQQLLAQRGRVGPLPPLTRDRAGFGARPQAEPPEPGKPATFMSGRPTAAPEAAAAAPSTTGEA